MMYSVFFFLLILHNFNFIFSVESRIVFKIISLLIPKDAFLKVAEIGRKEQNLSKILYGKGVYLGEFILTMA